MPVPQVPLLQILSATFHADSSGVVILSQLHVTITQLTYLIRRTCAQRHGLKKPDTCRLVQALLVSRITYGTPYFNLKQKEHAKLDVLIRKLYKIALSLPIFTPTARLLRLGIHNPHPKLLEAQLVQQLTRLALTPMVHMVLHKLGYRTPPPFTLPSVSLPHSALISPRPRHILPQSRQKTGLCPSPLS